MMSGICAVPGLLYRGQFPDIWHFIFLTDMIILHILKVNRKLALF